MDIYFLRHANAGEPKLNSAQDDKRRLDKLGIEQSHDVGRALAALDVTVDAIISSPLRRATQTAAVVANEIGHPDPIVIDGALCPGATYEQFQQLLSRYRRQDAIMMVGHNPNLTQFLNQVLHGQAALPAIAMKKGGIARVEKAGGSAAVLKWYITPKVVRSLQQASASSSRPKTVSK